MGRFSGEHMYTSLYVFFPLFSVSIRRFNTLRPTNYTQKSQIGGGAYSSVYIGTFQGNPVMIKDFTTKSYHVDKQHDVKKLAVRRSRRNCGRGLSPSACVVCES